MLLSEKISNSCVFRPPFLPVVVFLLVPWKIMGYRYHYDCRLPLLQVVSASGIAKISRNKLAGRVQLNELTMLLEWSKIGKLHMTLIKVCKLIIHSYEGVSMMHWLRKLYEIQN